MTLPADPPKLPKWPFLVGDGVLVAVAWIIAHQSPAPLPAVPLIAVVACVVVGAVLATYPFVIEYTRAQEIALDDRQRALETLSVTVATSSEQISIAANGLHEITELAQRNLKAAEQLPGKIHERLTAIMSGFEDSRADDREELQRELATLRATQTDKLADVADSIARSVSDLATSHLSAQRQISASAEAISRASASLAPFDAQMSATIQRAEKVFAAVPHPPLDERRGHAVNLPDETAFLNQSAVPSAPSRATEKNSSEVSPSISAAPSDLGSISRGASAPASAESSSSVESNPPQTEQELISSDPFTAAIVSVLEPDKAHASPVYPEVLAPPEPAPIPTQNISEIVPVAPRDSASMSPMLLPSDTTKIRRRAPRKPKSTTPPIAPAADPAAAPVTAPSDNNSGSSPTLAEIQPTVPEPSVEPTVTVPPESPVVEPASVASPEAPHTEPIAVQPPEVPPAESPSNGQDVAPPPSDPEPVSPSRGEVPLDVASPVEPEVADPSLLDSESAPPPAAAAPESAEVPELALSSDGATRLLVTAYIGIGNRLFIRGDGAGLNWEKGVPLQFVSIGKWRWETHETTGPLAFKLYKNDTIECAELTVTTLEPGRQHEVVAKF